VQASAVFERACAFLTHEVVSGPESRQVAGDDGVAVGDAAAERELPLLSDFGRDVICRFL
jgi:hypothetical protein